MVKQETLRDARARETRSRLIAKARQLFATKGFFATATEDIVAAAGVTRGALYHHFRDKEELFGLVFEDVQRDLTARIRRDRQGGASRPPTLDWSYVRAALHSYIGLAARSEYQQIFLRDAPAVFGWTDWRERQMRHGRTVLTDALSTVWDDRAHAGGDVAATSAIVAQLLLAMVDEAAQIVANSDDADRALASVHRALDLLIPEDRRQTA